MPMSWPCEVFHVVFVTKFLDNRIVAVTVCFHSMDCLQFKALLPVIPLLMVGAYSLHLFKKMYMFFLRAPAIVAYLSGQIFATLNAKGMCFGSNSRWSE